MKKLISMLLALPIVVCILTSTQLFSDGVSKAGIGVV